MYKSTINSIESFLWDYKNADIDDSDLALYEDININKIIMLSEAGRQYERSKKIKPLQKAQRERVYKSFSLQINKPVGSNKFSPFNTVSRQSRNSYLLRVTNQPNVGTLYQPNYSLTLPQQRRSTIDQAKFKRIIGEVKDEDFSIERTQISKKCQKAHINHNYRPLTVNQTHNWRKNFQHFDFSKQQDSKRLSTHGKLTRQQSTSQDFMNNLMTITQSNFNNFKRFSLKPNPNKAHKFESNSPHKYLQEVQKREKSPEYDIQASDQSFIHKSMPKTKGQKRFFLYRQKIVTRQDRADKDWHTFLQYQTQSSHQIPHSGNFDQQTDRRHNEVHSKYPIRLSLTRPLRVKN